MALGIRLADALRSFARASEKGYALVRWLLANDLVDQLDLVTYPVIVGQGTRPLPDAGPDTALELLASRTMPGGITIQTYGPSGRPRYQTDTLDTSGMSALGRSANAS